MNLKPVPGKALTQSYFDAPTLRVARALLGKHLVMRRRDGVARGRIVETEAYCGPEDQACHASRGRTKRTEVMFGPPGHWYVYLIYGMYHCLNIVTEARDFPAAVLIRGVTPLAGLPEDAKTDGPGKLCRAFGIGRELNARPAHGPEATLWIEDCGDRAPAARVRRTPRIGINYAGEYRDKPWRFVLDDRAGAPQNGNSARPRKRG